MCPLVPEKEILPALAFTGTTVPPAVLLYFINLFMSQAAPVALGERTASQDVSVKEPRRPCDAAERRKHPGRFSDAWAKSGPSLMLVC